MKTNEKPFEIIVLGPPVSGKGTQADLLSATFAIPHISAGQILHTIKEDKANPLSAQVVDYMNAGKLVPGRLVDQLILERVKKDDCRFGFVLDGYPRTLDQAKTIDGASDLDYVFLVDVSDETIIERLSGRRVCQSGHTWHLKYSPTKKEGICDACGEELFQRDDDKTEVVSNRLAIYHGEMAPIIEFYENKKILIKVNGEQNIEKVFQEMVGHLVYDLRGKVLK